MTTPTHRVAKFLPAGSVNYHVGDLVDAGDWNNTPMLVSTDYLIPLSKGEIEALQAQEQTSEPEPEQDYAEVIIEITTPLKNKATAKKATAKK